MLAIDAEVQRLQAARPGATVHRAEVVREILLRAFEIDAIPAMSPADGRKSQATQVHASEQRRAPETRRRQPRASRAKSLP